MRVQERFLSSSSIKAKFINCFSFSYPDYNKNEIVLVTQQVKGSEDLQIRLTVEDCETIIKDLEKFRDLLNVYQSRKNDSGK